jgi:hypothetical protein
MPPTLLVATEQDDGAPSYLDLLGAPAESVTLEVTPARLSSLGAVTEGHESLRTVRVLDLHLRSSEVDPNQRARNRLSPARFATPL